MKKPIMKILKKNQLTEEEEKIVKDWYIKLNDLEKINILKIVKGLKGKGVGLYVVGSSKINFEEIREGIYDSIPERLIKKFKEYEVGGFTKTPPFDADTYQAEVIGDIDIVYITPEVTKISEMSELMERDILKFRENLRDKIKEFEFKGQTKQLERYAKKRDLRTILVPVEGKMIDLLIEAKELKEKDGEWYNEMYSNTEDYEKDHENYIVLYRGKSIS